MGNVLRNPLFPHPLSLPSPTRGVPVASQKDDKLLAWAGGTSFSGRGGVNIKILSKVLNEKWEHIYSSILIIEGRGGAYLRPRTCRIRQNECILNQSPDLYIQEE